MKQLTSLCFLFLFLQVFAQSQINTDKKDSVSIELQKVNSALNKTQNRLNQIENKYSALSKKFNENNAVQNQMIDSLRNLINSNTAGLKESTESLGLRIDNTAEKANSGINNLKAGLSKNTFYWIIGTAFAILLAVVLFVLLHRTLKTNTDRTTKQLEDTRKSLEEEGIKLDNKLIELLEKQLSIQEVTPAKADSNNNGIDHSLALKVADEIVRIQKNISQMDVTIKGRKQLDASVERIRSNFEANGYEIPNLIGKSFDSGDKMIVVNSVPDDNLREGEQIISRIIKPQVNYKGKMIQAAQVEVKVG